MLLIRPAIAPAVTRSVTAVVLLGVEHTALFLLLAWFFDGDAVARLPEAWRGVVWSGTVLLTGALLGLCAAVIFWGERLLRALLAIGVPAGWDRGWLALHAASCLAFAGMSFAFLNSAELAEAGGSALLGLWLGTGLFLAFSLLRAAFGAALGDLARRLGGVALAAGLLGALTSIVLSLILPYWETLAWPTLLLSAGLLALSGQAVAVDPGEFLIRVGDFVVQVEATCSGIEGIGLIALFLSGYLWHYRAEHRLPRALLIVPAGILLSFLANCLRIAILVLIGAHVSPEIASGAFHSMAGWIFFCALTIGLIALSRRVGWLRRDEARVAIASENPTAAYLVPFLLWLAIGLVASAMVREFDALYPLRVLLVGSLLLIARRSHAEHVRIASGGTVAPWAIGLVVFLVWLALVPSEPPRTFGEVAAATGWPPLFLLLWVGCRLIGTVVVVPIVEELAFRGYLQRRLVAADFWEVPPGHWSWPAVLGSAMAFGLLHGAWVAGIFAGIAFSYAMHLRGRLADAVIAHGVANLLLSVWVLGFGRWDLW